MVFYPESALERAMKIQEVILRAMAKTVEKPLRGKPKAGFPLRLEIPQPQRDSHFPTATAAAND
jgi:hypothetical protein